jgi:hypothetical protein
MSQNSQNHGMIAWQDLPDLPSSQFTEEYIPDDSEPSSAANSSFDTAAALTTSKINVDRVRLKLLF